MRALVIRRLFYMVPTMFAISLVAFLIIQLPPGNYLTTYIAELSARGQSVDQTQIRALEQRYGLDDPMFVQYLRWIGGIVLHGDFGQSFQYQRDVSDLIWDRVGISVALALATIVVSWGLAIPIGIYSACASTPSATTSSPSSDSSAWPPRTSCSPCCSCGSHSPTSARA